MPDPKTALADIAGLVQSRQFAKALAQAQASMQQFPSSREIALKMAELLLTCRHYDQALKMFTAIHLRAQRSGEKTDLSVLTGLANCQIKTGELDAAKLLLEKLNTIAPDNADVLIPLASYRRLAKQLDQAEQLIDTVLDLHPDHPEGLHEKAMILSALNRTEEALPLLERNIKRTDVHGASIDPWLSILKKQGRDRYGQDTLKELSAIHPNILEFAYGHAVLANQNGEISEARRSFEKALALDPNNHRILYEFGLLERVAGNLVHSQELIDRSLQIHPDSPAALRLFGASLTYEYGDENYKRLNYVAAKYPEFSDQQQIHLHFAQAKAAENVGELDTAFRHYAVGGAKKRALDPYDEAQTTRRSAIIAKEVTPANLAATKESGFSSDVPVFILGMPRSGTTLMEQILSAHPDVFGAGELKFMRSVLENIRVNRGRIRMDEKEPVFAYRDKVGWEARGAAYVERIQGLTDRPYKRIIDKMPGNHHHVGLIHAILPNAKIIHSRRHPVETCLSCYRILFAQGHRWTYDLRELGRYYRSYWNLMEHWRTAFPGLMYEAVYEENIHDVETSAKSLVSHLGLEWDDRCLEFYNLDRPVKTASATQVRQPIYKTSTNRWRTYEKHLAPLLEEIGDLVAEYEAGIAHLIEE